MINIDEMREVTPLGLQAERKNCRLVVSLPTRGIAATSLTTTGVLVRPRPGPRRSEGATPADRRGASTFDVVGCLGVAITVILCLTVAVDRLPVLRRLAAPVIAVGTMSLTLYVSHILVILALPGEAVTPPQSASFELLLCFVVGATLFAAIWSRFFHRGPLEYLLNTTTKLANRVR